MAFDIRAHDPSSMTPSSLCCHVACPDCAALPSHGGFRSTPNFAAKRRSTWFKSLGSLACCRQAVVLRAQLRALLGRARIAFLCSHRGSIALLRQSYNMMQNALGDAQRALQSALERGIPEHALTRMVERLTSDVEKLASRQPINTRLTSPLATSSSLPALNRGSGSPRGVPLPGIGFRDATSSPPPTFSPPSPPSTRDGKVLLPPNVQAGMKPWGLNQSAIKTPLARTKSSPMSMSGGDAGSSPGLLAATTTSSKGKSPAPGRGRGANPRGGGASSADRKAQAARAAAHVIGALRSEAEALGTERKGRKRRRRERERKEGEREEKKKRGEREEREKRRGERRKEKKGKEKREKEGERERELGKERERGRERKRKERQNPEEKKKRSFSVSLSLPLGFGSLSKFTYYGAIPTNNERRTSTTEWRLQHK